MEIREPTQILSPTIWSRQDFKNVANKRRHRNRMGRHDMDQGLRNKLRNVVTQCRKLLEKDTTDSLEGKYGIFAKKDQVTADPNAKMAHLTGEERQHAKISSIISPT